jgi:hypothetical protein
VRPAVVVVGVHMHECPAIVWEGEVVVACAVEVPGRGDDRSGFDCERL